jgi:DNA-binding response OmpR family regulator
MLTAHGTLESAVDAIQEGVDGYLLKPVRPSEVRQAVEEALYRRQKVVEAEQQATGDHILQRGPFRVDLERHEATFEGRSLDLSPRDFTLLVHLMQNAPQVIGPKELVRVVRQYEPEHMHEAREIIKWYIHRLRKKIEPDPSNPRYILNVRGVGYRFAS